MDCATIPLAVKKSANKKPRLSREAWLQQALDTLAEDPTHLRIDELATRLGVSKGSFYWHFGNREDFVQRLAAYWRDQYTLVVIGAVSSADGAPEERLRLLLTQILTQRYARYDPAIRAWARLEPGILPVVREVDELRLKILRGLFSEMGFTGTDLEMRTRIFVVCHSFEDALSIDLKRKNLRQEIDTRLAFFMRPVSKA